MSPPEPRPSRAVEQAHAAKGEPTSPRFSQTMSWGGNDNMELFASGEYAELLFACGEHLGRVGTLLQEATFGGGGELRSASASLRCALDSLPPRRYGLRPDPEAAANASGEAVSSRTPRQWEHPAGVLQRWTRVPLSPSTDAIPAFSKADEDKTKVARGPLGHGVQPPISEERDSPQKMLPDPMGGEERPALPEPQELEEPVGVNPGMPSEKEERIGPCFSSASSGSSGTISAAMHRGTLRNRARPSKSERRNQRVPKSLPVCFVALRRVVDNPFWEVIWGVVILCSIAILIVEEEYRGMIEGNALGIYDIYGSDQYVEKWWPSALLAFEVSEVAFVVMFTLELVVSFAHDLLCRRYKQLPKYRTPFWKSSWDLIDFFVVLFANISILGHAFVPLRVQLLRLLRFMKLLGLLGLMRKIAFFDPLITITTALKRCIGAFTASVLLLGVILTLPSLVLTNGIRLMYLQGAEQPDTAQREVQEQLFLYFGTYSRSMVSMLELALANWPPITRFMMDNLHEGFGVLFVVFKLTVGFAVVSCINGMFVKICFNAAENDDFILMRNRARQASQQKARMTRLFKLADRNNDGNLDKKEFHRVIRKPAIRSWLEAIDFQITDGDKIFNAVAGEDGLMTASELIDGVEKLRGPAKRIDMITLMSRLDQMDARCDLDQDVAAAQEEQVEDRATTTSSGWQQLEPGVTNFSRLSSGWDDLQPPPLDSPPSAPPPQTMEPVDDGSGSDKSGWDDLTGQPPEQAL